MQPKNFLKIEEAIELINKDTRSNATVDIAFLVKNLPWLRENSNYTIKLLRHEDGKVVPNGTKYVFLASRRDRNRLEDAIIEHYREVSRNHITIDPEQIGLKSVTTTVDTGTDANLHNAAGRPKINKQPQIKAGETLGSGEGNGANL